MSKQRILIIDDHEVVIEGIKSLLTDRDDTKVVGEALNGRDGFKKAIALKPDVIIMDLFMPEMSGLESAKLILKELPAARIVVYTMYSDAVTVTELFKVGISAYVLKEGPISDLLAALDALKKDATFFRTVASRAVADHLESRDKVRDDLDRLSPREREVFELLTQGQPIKAIAERLCLSRKTVETHKYHLMEKLKIFNIAELVRFSVERKK